VSAFVRKDTMSVYVRVWFAIYIIIYGRPIRERACVLDRIRARERSMTVFDVRRRFVDRPTFCVSLHCRIYRHTTACVYSHISACKAILCSILTHTQTHIYIYVGNTVVGGALSQKGGCIYIYICTQVVWWKRRVSVYIAFSLSLFLFFARATHIHRVRNAFKTTQTPMLLPSTL
jgi:hypothetical protein